MDLFLFLCGFECVRICERSRGPLSWSVARWNRVRSLPVCLVGRAVSVNGLCVCVWSVRLHSNITGRAGTCFDDVLHSDAAPTRLLRSLRNARAVPGQLPRFYMAP